MSDTVTSVEIEDVLSSIRRLISEDPDATRKTPKKMTDRFVLTPALRVKDKGSSKSTLNGSAAMPLTDVSAKPDQSAATADVQADAALTPEAETEWEHVAETDTDSATPFRTSRIALEARIAELEAAVSRSREEWEPDGSETDSVEMPSRHLFAQPKGEISEAEIIEDEESPQDAEKDASGIGAVPKTAAGKQRTGPDAVGPEGQSDDEFLRKFVAEIVQQELQGELGERITRNVRRMVRREIQQALALKGIE